MGATCSAFFLGFFFAANVTEARKLQSGPRDCGGVKAVNEERQKGNFSRLSLSLLFSFSILETFFDSPSGDLSSEAAAE